MTTEINVQNATVNLLLTIGIDVHLVALSQDDMEAISFLVKRAVKGVIPTGRNQLELNQFLNYKE